MVPTLLAYLVEVKFDGNFIPPENGVNVKTSRGN